MKKILKSGSRLLKQLSLPTYYKFKYKRVMGYWPNFKNPQLLSEKIVWLNLYYYPSYDLAIELGDKSGLRNRYLDSDLSQYLPPIWGVYNSVDEINFDELPNKFVVKKSSGSNMNAIVTDKSHTDISILKDKVNSWMAIDYGELTGEKHYSYMSSKIIVEKYLDNIQREYRIFCFDGIPKFATTVELKMLMNDKSDFIDRKEVLGKKIIDIEKLISNNQSIDYILSTLYPDISSIPLVRVDIIETNDHIYLGELTFTPSGGILPDYDERLQLELGSYLRLPMDIK